MAAINQVMLSEAVHNNRFSAEFFDPQYVFKPSASSTWLPIGRILKKCEYGISISMNTEGDGYPIFRMNEIENCFALRPEKFAAIPNFIFQQYKLNENDVLFNRTNSFEFVGRTGIVKDQTDCTFASYLIRLVPDSNIILPEYLTIYLNTPFGIGQIKRRAMRSINQANVSGAEVKKILIPIASVAEQQKVANDLNDAFSAARKGEQLYKDAQHLLESELGLDNLTFKRPVGYMARFSEIVSNDRVDADFYQVKYKQLDAIATKFPIKKVKEISEKLETGVYSQSYSAKGTMYLRGVDIDKGFIKSESILKTNLLIPNPKNTVVKDDIIVTRVGSIGVCAIIEDDHSGSLFSDNLIRVRLHEKAKEEIAAPYLNLLLNTTYGQMQMTRYSRGSVQQRLNQTQLAQIPIPIIEKEAQSKIKNLLDKHRSAEKESKKLLEQAKARVEKLIEEAAAQ